MLAGLFDSLSQILAESGALVAAIGAAAGGIAALGYTKRDTKRTADDQCEQRVEEMIGTFWKGVNLGKQIPTQPAERADDA